jgi:hypothetical protein
MPNIKDYINNVYQPHSRYVSSMQNGPKLGDYNRERSNWIEGKIESFNQTSNSNYVAPIQYDPKLGAYYSERSNWMGGQTEDLSQAMSDYIFQPVNFR